MALSDSISAYDDCFELFERAETDGKGARTLLATWSEAHMLRMRMNQARVLERRQSARAFEKTDPRHGKSAFDKWKVTIRESAEKEGYWLYVELWTVNQITVEGLSE
jgi:hypothetical protein